MHLSYVQNNGTAATNFIVSQSKSNAGGSSGGNGSGNPTVTASSSTTLRATGNVVIALMALTMGMML